MRGTPRTPESVTKHVIDYKPKPFTFPPEMVILIDSREQQSPLFGRYPKGMTVSCCKLEVGDYSIRGLESKIAVERKQISDLISYCTTEREATKRKMAQLQKLEWAGLLIEARESEVYRPYLFSNVSPEAIRQSLVSFSVRYGVHVYIGDTEKCRTWLLDRLIKFYRIKHEL